VESNLWREYVAAQPLIGIKSTEATWTFNSKLFRGNQDAFERWIDKYINEDDAVLESNLRVDARVSTCEPPEPLITSNHVNFTQEPALDSYTETLFKRSVVPSGLRPAIQFPTERRVVRRAVSTESDVVIQAWFDTCGIKLGPLLPTDRIPYVQRLLYTYKDINATELRHIPPTDLYTHRVRLKAGTKP
jgi:hypothetical protein